MDKAVPLAVINKYKIEKEGRQTASIGLGVPSFKPVPNEKMRSLILIGLPGSGKTVCGQMLAKKLGWVFLDTDKIIEKKSKMTILELFQGKGEAYFRQLEKELLDDLVVKTNAGKNESAKEKFVIATGGGMPIATGNWEILTKIGELIFLDADNHVIWQRLRGAFDRPLLLGHAQGSDKVNGEQMMGQLDRLSKARLEIYRQACYRVDTSKLSPQEVVEVIIRLLG